MQQILTSPITKFIHEYYSNQYATLLSGSHVDSKNNEFSDIDVIVFTTDRAYGFQ